MKYQITTARGFAGPRRRRSDIEVITGTPTITELTKEQLKAIKADPMLNVVEYKEPEPSADKAAAAKKAADEKKAAEQQAEKDAAEAAKREADDKATAAAEAEQADKNEAADNLIQAETAKTVQGQPSAEPKRAPKNMVDTQGTREA